MAILTNFITPPWVLLGGSVALAAGAVVIDRISRYGRHAQLRALAGRLRMHFAARDALRLCPRVRDAFPIPGAAGIRIADLIYASDATAYRYLFTVEYTLGAVRSRRRVRRAASMIELRGEAAMHPAATLTLGDAGVSIADQYEMLAGDLLRTRA